MAQTEQEPIKIYQPVYQNSKKIRNRYGSTNPRGELPPNAIFSPKQSDIAEKSSAPKGIKKVV
jgi:hypothetical protein